MPNKQVAQKNKSRNPRLLQSRGSSTEIHSINQTKKTIKINENSIDKIKIKLISMKNLDCNFKQ